MDAFRNLKVAGCYSPGTPEWDYFRESVIDHFKSRRACKPGKPKPKPRPGK